MAVINTNYLALVSQNNLNKSQSTLGSAIERLSSGLRINSAKDDAAGQAIANRMTAQIRGMTQAARNANDGISLTQTAEGNLNEINNNLQRIRELAVQAVNSTNSTTDLASIQQEVNDRLAEITRVVTNAEFNGTKLLDGSANNLVLQVGANAAADNQITVSIADASSAGAAVTLAVGDATVLTDLDTRISAIDTARSNLGSVQNRLTSTVNNLNNTITNLSASRSRIEDADYAVEVSNMTRAQILQQAGTAVLAQANQVPQTMLSLLR
jgi:flagellin